MSINNNISKFANTVDSSGQIDFADLANKPTTLAGYGITDGASGGSVTSYTNASDLPLSGNSAGDLAYVVETNRMYVNTGSGWYSISLVNTDPSITSVQDANSNTTPFTLSTDGTATVITITASDPEGVPVTYSYSVTSGSLTNGGGTTATVSQGTGANTNVFTITPTTTEDYAGAFTITFTVSDGVNTSTSANAFSLQFSIDNAKYTTLLLKADASSSDNQVDASTNSLTITETGTATSTAFSPYHPKGYSVYFDGSGDYLTANVPTNNTTFTAECWFYQTANAGDGSSAHSIISSWNNQGVTPKSWLLQVADNGSGQQIRSIFSSDGTSNSISYDGTVTNNTWHHVALVADGTNATLYLDGTQIRQTAIVINTNSENFRIGDSLDNSASSAPFQGYISDARFVRGSAVYTSAFTPPTERLTAITNTDLLACHLPYIADGSSDDVTITVGGNAQPKQFGPYNYNTSYSKSSHGGSVYFNSSNGDALEIPYNSGFALDGDFTIETWIYHISHSGNYTGIIANANDNISQGPTSGFSFSFYATTNRLSFQTGSGLNLTTTNAIPTYAWTHLAVVRSGSTVTVYVNGEAQTSGSSSSTFDAGSSYDLYLARGRASSGVPYVTCYMSDTRIVKGTAVYTADFTPPTSPLTAISGTQLLTCTNKHEIWDAASGESITLNGNVDASTTQYKWGNSVAFDGAGDYLSITSSSDLYDFGTGDFTIEFWMYLNSYTTGDIVADARAVWNDQGWSFEQQNNGIMLYSSGGQRLTTSAINTSTAQWIHVAFARESGTLRSYINGANETSVTYSTAINTTASTIRIGQRQDNGGTQLDGYIEDFRITKGLARYTSTFTAPSSTFAG